MPAFRPAVTIILAIAASLLPQGAAAAPPGRVWTAPETLLAAGSFDLPGPAFVVDGEQNLTLITNQLESPIDDIVGMAWADSMWVETWRLEEEGIILRPVYGPGHKRAFVWSGGDKANSDQFNWSEIVNGQVQATERIAQLNRSFVTEYGGARSPTRRWAAVSESVRWRLFYSDAWGVWTEVPVTGRGNRGISIAALDDTTALVVWSGSEGVGAMSWGILEGSTWKPSPDLLGIYFQSRPVLRERPSGGHWLMWGSGWDSVGVLTFRDGIWTDPRAIFCDYDPGGVNTIAIGAPVMSVNDGEYPAVTWYTTSTSGAEPGCVMIPDANGFTLGEDVIPSPAFPSGIARDRNGDVWVAWWYYFLPTKWMHTYTVATASTPTINPVGTDRTLHWTLSELAPETWWAVLASRNGGPYEEAARVRAEDALEMSWTDTSPPVTEIRYRIRRECVDTRYQWLSDEVVWDGATATEVSLSSAESEPDRVVLIWQGAGAGALAAQVERRSETSAWQTIGDAESLDADRLRYEDRAVTPGERYAYRLTWFEEGAERHTAESWVEVPVRPELALEGFTPNPSIRDAVVAFTLPSAGRGRLEVMDVAGRRVYRRDLDGFGAGRHTLTIEPSRPLRAGVYLIRLSHGGRVLHARGVVTR